MHRGRLDRPNKARYVFRVLSEATEPLSTAALCKKAHIYNPGTYTSGINQELVARGIPKRINCQREKDGIWYYRLVDAVAQ